MFLNQIGLGMLPEGGGMNGADRRNVSRLFRRDDDVPIYHRPSMA